MKLKDDEVEEEEEEEGAASLAHEQGLVTPPWCLDLRVTLMTAMMVAWGLMTFEWVWPGFTCSFRLNSQQDGQQQLSASSPSWRPQRSPSKT